MPPRIAYWASSFVPEMEAIASEVACLRRAFPGSVVWGVSPRESVRLSWRRGFGVHPRWHLMFRGATWLAQRAFDINHVYGGLGDWFHLTAVHKQPIVLTMALSGPACDNGLLAKVDRFVVEWPAARDELQQLGVDPQRIRLVFPPIDLARFRPAPVRDSPFTVLFASSPERADWLEARGVHLILDAAAIRPDMQFRLIWRPWGNSLAEVRRWIEERELSNVDLVVGRFGNMAEHYQQSHVTVAPFTRPDCCKPVPNSLLESLACARPVVVTSAVGFSDVVHKADMGIMCSETAEGLADALDVIRARWTGLSERARLFAERSCGVERFVQAYGELYSELLP
ncbi:MAG: glycosyltransferase [Pirellulaceae bacterium]